MVVSSTPHVVRCRPLAIIRTAKKDTGNISKKINVYRAVLVVSVSGNPHADHVRFVTATQQVSNRCQHYHSYTHTERLLDGACRLYAVSHEAVEHRICTQTCRIIDGAG